MRIYHVASECAPFAKVGGLGDVVYGLCRELTRLGHDTTIILPKYDTFEDDIFEELKRADFPSFWHAKFQGVSFLLFDPENGMFQRQKIYGEIDDNDRFLYFSKCAYEYINHLLEPIDILHLHDWQTAILAPLFNGSAQIGKTILTIHNAFYQGICNEQNLRSTSLDTSYFPKLRDGENYNLLKGGITFTDLVTTVSPTYAEEIATTEKGYGLQEILSRHGSKLHGILNGIDTTYWDPESDPCLKAHYSIKSAQKGKKENRKALFKRLKFTPCDGPLFCAITRLVKQKGPKLIEHAVETTLKEGGVFVLLGSHPAPELQALFEAQQTHPSCYLHFLYDEELAHLTYAASDFILIPSLFEPCGLTQMIAMRYGTIPIVHKTGGLADSVKNGETGYVFEAFEESALDDALQRAFDDFPHHEMMKRCMEQDFSWKHAAQEYISLYR